MSAEHETILVDHPRPGVARITLNRPQAMNAYTWRMTQELQAAIAAFRDDDAQKALLVAGAGERAFCTGGDISGTGGDPAHGRWVREAPMGHGREMREGMQAVVAMLRRLDKPSVAMIRGYAVAGGLALALGCDIRLAAASAKLGDTAGKVGLLPDEGGAWLFPHAMGLDRALKMSLLNEIYDAATAERLGLVTEVAPDAELEGRALAMCEALAGKAPLAVRLIKMMMAKAMETGFESSLADAQMAVMIANPSQDVREGTAAFREKRAPKFQGR
ncbi:MAG TPA: enoyl-CoA hydratase-related protein [Phenylobacterium sp.]|uniref:enoyl-CoA hydratase/isomerase family protein n=1 Tax=Phenylobacterium sp. TaxID=1871053 RepID=UPI002D088808|nr:enoyl-CoA hydratase-related protein [Phenylobacterium sp.]HSV04372.1 enoyl-CoA hydratase-related protein [Phenylobacterium sp.]